MLAGAVAAGFLLALFISNTSGVWSAARSKLSNGESGVPDLLLNNLAGDPLMDAATPALDISASLIATLGRRRAPC